MKIQNLLLKYIKSIIFHKYIENNIYYKEIFINKIKLYINFDILLDLNYYFIYNIK